MLSLAWHSLVDRDSKHHNGVKMPGNVNFVYLIINVVVFMFQE